MIPSWMRFSDGNFIENSVIDEKGMTTDKPLTKKQKDAIQKALYKPVENK